MNTYAVTIATKVQTYETTTLASTARQAYDLAVEEFRSSMEHRSEGYEVTDVIISKVKG